jgi:hypothetical protein
MKRNKQFTHAVPAFLLAGALVWTPPAHMAPEAQLLWQLCRMARDGRTSVTALMEAVGNLNPKHAAAAKFVGYCYGA